MAVFEDECRAAGLDPRKINRIAKRLGSAARDAKKLGLIVFGGTGSGSLRWSRDTNRHRLVVADIDGGSWDGGDGGYGLGADGLNRGE